MGLDPATQNFFTSMKQASPLLEPAEGVSLEPTLGTLFTDSTDVTGTIDSPKELKTPVTAANLFSNPATHPIIFNAFLENKYGPEWVTWMPDSLWIVIKRDFKGDIASITKEKINAVKTLLMVDFFWRSWDIFEKIVHGLNHNIVRFDIIQPPTLGQLINAVRVAKRLRGKTAPIFEQEVASYVAAVAREEGVEWLPAPLDFAQKSLGEVPADVKRRFEELSKTTGPVVLKETPEDVQSAKLLIAFGYTAFRDKEEATQMRILA